MREPTGRVYAGSAVALLRLYLTLTARIRLIHTRRHFKTKTKLGWRYTMVVLWGIVVPHIAHASFCVITAKPRAHASQRQIRFQSWRKATKASFLKTSPFI